MSRRNEPCPCGSGVKFKRCCLQRIDLVARELRDRDALLANVVDWVRDEHPQTLEDASSETTVIRILRGRTGRSMSTVWALNDFAPTDGGPPLMSRFAARAELDSSERELAQGLAEARLDVYRVCAITAGVGIELEALAGSAPIQILADDGLEALDVGDILVARIVRTTSTPTLWGTAAHFDGAGERRWLARLAALPADRAQAGRILLGFHPDDAAEPLPDGLELSATTWPIDDDEAVLEALEDEQILECIGEAIPSGWAFSWLDEATCGSPDLGGWREDDRIEVARLLVCEREMTVLSGDRETLRTAVAHVQGCLDHLIAAPRLGRAA
jgi:SEC-C motif